MRPSDWLCGSVSGIMVVWRKGMPDAILEVMMLAMSKVFSITQGHLFTAVPCQLYGFSEFISDWSFVSAFSQ